VGTFFKNRNYGNISIFRQFGIVGTYTIGIVALVIRNYGILPIRKVGVNEISVHATEFTTNNPAENFNKKLKSRIKITRRPNFWRFVEIINEVFIDSDLDFERLTNQSLQITRSQCPKTKANIAKRREMEQKLARKLVSPVQFLYAVSHTIDSVVTRSMAHVI
jgi:hypothetical protein